MTDNIGRAKPVTMDDLAKIAGVHSRTVADALKGTGRVAPATREKVLRIAKELNYIPNATARALATGRTGKVAVLSGPLNDHYYANAVHLLGTHLTAHGYEMMLLQSRREVDDLVNVTKPGLVDGIIVVGINSLADQFLHIASPTQPCVLICTAQPDFVDHITLDLPPAVEEALQMMLDAGRKRIAYVANNRDQFAAKEGRVRTYYETMKKAGLSPEIIDVNTSQSADQRIQGIKAYIEEHGCPEALFCHNDETAIHTYQAMVALGLRVPEDVLLAGCDGLPYMEYFETPLSTISLPMDEICEIAADFLQKRMATPGIPMQQKTVEGQLIVRKSLMVG